RTANDRGIRVIADLVVNHTSDRHPWFTASRSSTDGPYRDFYVWRADEPPPTKDEVIFPDQEGGIWTKDDRTGEWYRHRFYRHMPDLNTANPLVRDAIAKSMGYWVQLGLSGFRVDAVPFFLGDAAANPSDEIEDPHDFLRALRSFLSRRTGDSILMGEVNLPFAEQRLYFGDDGEGDGSESGPSSSELTLQFDFNGMQAMYLSLARHDAGPLAASLEERPPIPHDAQWATFVRNHDELTLDKLSEDERQEVFAAFGPEEDMQLYGRGLRRRLPPMLGGDPRHVRMVYSLLFALPCTPVLFSGEEIGMRDNLAAHGRLAARTPMPWTSRPNGGPRRALAPMLGGDPRHVRMVSSLLFAHPRTPVLFYGEEIGMAENLAADGRLAVRTPMQWTPGPDGGFSRAPARRLSGPVPGDGYAPEHVNVADQRRDPDSLLTFVRLLAHRYRDCPELGRGDVDVLDQPEASVLALRSTWQEASLVTLHNLSPDPVVVPLALGELPEGARLVDLLDADDVEPDPDGKAEVRLDGYGYRWLRVTHPGSRRLL